MVAFARHALERLRLWMAGLDGCGYGFGGCGWLRGWKKRYVCVWLG